MPIYRFRIILEDNEDITRDIDILATQNFFELQAAILKAMEFDDIHPSSWHRSDDFWRKGKSLSHSESVPAGHPDHPLANVFLNQVINDPHQKFLFQYDVNNADWLFLIELLKILPEEKNRSYPFCSKSSGNSIKQYKVILPPAPENDEDGRKKKKSVKTPNTIVSKPKPSNTNLEDDEIDDTDAYREEEDFENTSNDSGYNDDELNSLEGEEGEQDDENNDNDEFEDDDFDNDEENYGGNIGGDYGDSDERY